MPSIASQRASRMLFIRDLLGVAVFAISGALAAMRLGLDCRRVLHRRFASAQRRL